jgi:hypothetical protein
MPLIYTQHATQHELDHEFRALWAQVDALRAQVAALSVSVGQLVAATEAATPAAPN